MKLRSELEIARDERRFGSGWISGTLALLSGLTGSLMLLAERFPALTIPEMGMVRGSSYYSMAVYGVLIAGFILAALSLVLRRNKTLGTVAMAAVLAGSAIGAIPVQDHLTGEFHLGLDFFVLNTLLIGFLFIPLERLFPRDPEQYVFREEWREDIFYYLVSSLFVQMLTYFTLTPSKLISSSIDLSALHGVIATIPWLLQLVIVMFVTDTAQYWLHRAFHRVPFLWNFHAVHHSAKSMDWLAGARMHFLEVIVLRAVTATPMFVLGFDPSVVQTYILIVYLWSSFLHANLGWSFGSLEKIVAMPRFHHWHHGIEREAIDVNFAIHFPLLDRLFGTYHLPEDRWPEGYGIQQEMPRGWLANFAYPFREWVKARRARKAG